MRNLIIPIISFIFLITLLLSACSDPLDPVSVNENSDLLNSFEHTANKAAHASSSVYRFADGSEVEGAEATLLRTRSNVRMTIKTLDLDPHDTYTVWWVIFNNPENCQNISEGDFRCDLFDLFFSEGVNASVLYAAGHVIGGNGKGNFAGSLREGDISGCQAPWDAFDLGLLDPELEGQSFDLCGEGLEDSSEADIHLVVRTHGPKIPGLVNDQINTFAGGCTAESSFGADLDEGDNECVDQQFAVFEVD